jgi:oligopeptide/dipeptide ABC transporter ATP-binding protein
MTAPLLEIRDLRASFALRGRRLDAVRGISLDVAAGETLGIVGESGSGKSVAMLSVMRLLAPGADIAAERLAFDGRDLLALPDRAMRDLRGRDIAMVFQDPLTALNPVLTVGWQIGEVLRRHRGLSREAARDEARALLARVGVPDPTARLRQFPHQFSGGMRQRVMIAMALAGRPRLLIADEPTTALDVTVQAEIVSLMKTLQAAEGMTVVWVTHDLGLLARVARRVVVMYAGRIVEDAAIGDLYARPAHPYTAGLLSSISRIDRPRAPLTRVIPGAPPDPMAQPAGCAFAPRCPVADEGCLRDEPPLAAWGAARRVACFKPGIVPAPDEGRAA